MVSKLSGSAEETDSTEPLHPDPPPYPSHGKKDSFTSAKYDITRHSDSLDRRKVEKGIGLTPLFPNRSVSAGSNTQAISKKELLLAPGSDDNKISEPRSWLRSRSRSPWSCTALIASVTALAGILFLFIIHAFLTRQLDSKGCDMCWSRPIYFKFSDFDTEHTRFASKYHLYLHREGEFDEDPTVGDIPGHAVFVS